MTGLSTTVWEVVMNTVSKSYLAMNLVAIIDIVLKTAFTKMVLMGYYIREDKKDFSRL